MSIAPEFYVHVLVYQASAPSPGGADIFPIIDAADVYLAPGHEDDNEQQWQV